MLRDVSYAVAVAATVGALYVAGVHLSPLSYDFGTKAREIVVLIGMMWVALGFLTGLLCSRYDGRLDDSLVDSGEPNLRFDEEARSRAWRLNTDCPAANTGSVVSAEVIPFPRLRSSRQPDPVCAGGHAVS